MSSVPIIQNLTVDHEGLVRSWWFTGTYRITSEFTGGLTKLTGTGTVQFFWPKNMYFKTMTIVFEVRNSADEVTILRNVHVRNKSTFEDQDTFPGVTMGGDHVYTVTGTPCGLPLGSYASNSIEPFVLSCNNSFAVQTFSIVWTNSSTNATVETWTVNVGPKRSFAHGNLIPTYQAPAPYDQYQVISAFSGGVTIDPDTNEPLSTFPVAPPEPLGSDGRLPSGTLQNPYWPRLQFAEIEFSASSDTKTVQPPIAYRFSVAPVAKQPVRVAASHYMSFEDESLDKMEWACYTRPGTLRLWVTLQGATGQDVCVPIGRDSADDQISMSSRRVGLGGSGERVNLMSAVNPGHKYIIRLGKPGTGQATTMYGQANNGSAIRLAVAAGGAGAGVYMAPYWKSPYFTAPTDKPASALQSSSSPSFICEKKMNGSYPVFRSVLQDPEQHPTQLTNPLEEYTLDTSKIGRGGQGWDSGFLGSYEHFDHPLLNMGIDSDKHLQMIHPGTKGTSMSTSSHTVAIVASDNTSWFRVQTHILMKSEIVQDASSVTTIWMFAVNKIDMPEPHLIKSLVPVLKMIRKEGTDTTTTDLDRVVAPRDFLVPNVSSSSSTSYLAVGTEFGFQVPSGMFDSDGIPIVPPTGVVVKFELWIDVILNDDKRHSSAVFYPILRRPGWVPGVYETTALEGLVAPDHVMFGDTYVMQWRQPIYAYETVPANALELIANTWNDTGLKTYFFRTLKLGRFQLRVRSASNALWLSTPFAVYPSFTLNRSLQLSNSSSGYIRNKVFKASDRVFMQWKYQDAGGDWADMQSPQKVDLSGTEQLGYYRYRGADVRLVTKNPLDQTVDSVYPITFPVSIFKLPSITSAKTVEIESYSHYYNKDTNKDVFSFQIPVAPNETLICAASISPQIIPRSCTASSPETEFECWNTSNPQKSTNRSNKPQIARLDLHYSKSTTIVYVSPTGTSTSQFDPMSITCNVFDVVKDIPIVNYIIKLVPKL